MLITSRKETIFVREVLPAQRVVIYSSCRLGKPQEKERKMTMSEFNKWLKPLSIYVKGVNIEAGKIRWTHNKKERLNNHP